MSSFKRALRGDDEDDDCPPLEKYDGDSDDESVDGDVNLSCESDRDH